MYKVKLNKSNHTAVEFFTVQLLISQGILRCHATTLWQDVVIVCLREMR